MAKRQQQAKRLVIVESPTKAKTLRKFLGRDYLVESCMGHIRDLPQSAKEIPEKLKKEKWANLGVNVDDDFAPIYCIPRNKTKVVDQLKERLKEADELILATDEDREGESISWHLVQVLRPKINTKRMVFHEITREAIEEALHNFRDIDTHLVHAQEARRILDRLVGYTISPLLWKKIAYGLSAGRVQSVAMCLIVNREIERLRFKKSEYWSVEAECEHTGQKFDSRLVSYKNQRIALGKDFDENTGELRKEKSGEVLHLQAAMAQKILDELKGKSWVVTDVEEKPISRRPAPPFITSTLQQEANRKFGWGTAETMQVAQKLYENGFITYMRTDSTFLSDQALKAARSCIEGKYGRDYLPSEPRFYAAKKVKGAQEAHEAIRPAGTTFLDAKDTKLLGRELKLYELIWKRTVASQMVNSEQKQVTVRMEVGPATFSTSGTIILFPGFLRAYVEGSDDPEASLEEREVHLPPLKVKDNVKCLGMKALDHETKPPARFTEAALVQKMEKEGIGRPSTYASIINTIIKRGYVRKQGNALVPSFTAIAVSKLLSSYLPQYVDLGFTSGMEESLDKIADGEMDHHKYLKNFYFGKEGLRSQVESKEKQIDLKQARSINLDGLKGLEFRIGRYGAYVCKQQGKTDEVCVSIPDSQAPGDITAETVEKLFEQKMKGTDALGKDPASGLPIYVLTGRYGPYVQLGESDGENAKPKRTSLPSHLKPEEVTLSQALFLVQLPKVLGQHPESKEDVKVGIGRFGPYVQHQKEFRSVPRGDDLFTVDFKKAMELLSQPKRGRGRSIVIKELGKHPATGGDIALMAGKYGPYLKYGKVNKPLAETDKQNPSTVDLNRAVQIIGDTEYVPEKIAAASPSTTEAKTNETKTRSAKSNAEKSAGSKVKKNPTKPSTKPSAKKIVRKVAGAKAKIRAS